jgi:hypothetical protein
LNSSLYIVLFANCVCCACLAYVIWRRKMLTRSSGVFPYFSINSPEARIEDAVKAFKFEKHVVALFDRSVFTLFYWKGASATTWSPTLELDFEENQWKYPLSVECKWIDCISEGKVFWCSHEQIEKFKAYERDSKRTVFVVIGVGGEPSFPSELFIVPLSKIARHMDNFTMEFLAPYRRTKPQSGFTFNRQYLRLL